MTSVEAIQVADVIGYLLQHGWSGVPDADVDSGYSLYRAPIADDFANPIDVAVPDPSNKIVAGDAVSRLLRTIAVLEGRKFEDVAKDVVGSPSDRLSIRLVPQRKQSRIQLRHAPDVYREVYRLFVYGASAEIYPEPRAGRVERLGLDFGSALLLSPAQERSYSFSVDSALADDFLLPHFRTIERVAEFRRSVMARVVRGLARCAEAGERGYWENMQDEYLHGLNANMCDALYGVFAIVGGNAASVEFGVSWSSALPVPSDLALTRVVRCDERTVEMATKLSTTLAVKKTPKKWVKFSGHVDALRDHSKIGEDDEGDRNDEDEDEDEAGQLDLFRSPKATLSSETRPERFATVRTDGRDVPRRIHFALSEGDYVKACAAHAGRTVVNVAGWMGRTRGRWWLDPCETFDTE